MIGGRIKNRAFKRWAGVDGPRRDFAPKGRDEQLLGSHGDYFTSPSRACSSRDTSASRSRSSTSGVASYSRHRSS